MKTCPKCHSAQQSGESCTNCGLIFRKYHPQPDTFIPDNQAPSATIVMDSPPENKDYWCGFSLVLSLLLALATAIQLSGLIPATSSVFGNLSLTFWQWFKHFFDLVTAGWLLVASLGLLFRKPWARRTVVLLLAMWLSETIILLASNWLGPQRSPEAGTIEAFMGGMSTFIRLASALFYAYAIRKLSSEHSRASFVRAKEKKPVHPLAHLTIPALAIGLVVLVMAVSRPTSQSNRYQITGKIVQTSPIKTLEGEHQVVRTEEHFYVSIRLPGEIQQRMIEVSQTYYQSVAIGDTISVDDVTREEAKF